MGRRLRYIPPEGSLVEVTCRTVHGRFLLRPSKRLNRITVGVIGRAQRKYPVSIIALVFLSNHYHLLLWVPNARRLAEFMNYVNGNLAREVGRLVNWREKFWGRRYQAIPVSSEPYAQIQRFEYILSHGVKEGLVRHPAEWRGVHALGDLLGDKPLEGVWIDRTKACGARLRGEQLLPAELESPETITLSPLPCWMHLGRAEYRRRIQEIVDRVVAEPTRGEGRSSLPLGPHERPAAIKRSPAPLFHCASKRAQRELHAAYAWFVAAYREATGRLSRGDPSPGFPEGSFPPSLPYVAAA